MARKSQKQGPPFTGAHVSVIPRWALDRVATNDPSARAVLWALCTFRNRTDGTAYPSVDTLAGLTALGARTVQRALRRLEDCHAIRTVSPATSTKPTRYGIPDRPLSLLSGCHGDAPWGVTDDTGGVSLCPAGGVMVTPELTTEQTTGTTVEASLSSTDISKKRARSYDTRTFYNVRGSDVAIRDMRRQLAREEQSAPPGTMWDGSGNVIRWGGAA